MADSLCCDPSIGGVLGDTPLQERFTGDLTAGIHFSLRPVTATLIEG